MSGVVDLDDTEYVCDVATDDFRVGRGSVEAAVDPEIFGPAGILGLVMDEIRLEALRPVPESVTVPASSWLLLRKERNCGKPISPDERSPARPFWTRATNCDNISTLFGSWICRILSTSSSCSRGMNSRISLMPFL